MSGKIKWDQDGERLYETGVDRGVLYPKTGDNGTYAKGVAWNGLTAVNEAPTGGEATAFYADNIKYGNLMSNEEFGFTIEAFTYPEEFEQCDGSASISNGVYLTQQRRKEFGFSYRTLVGNDEDGTEGEHSYKLHIVYNALAKPSTKNRSTVNESPEMMTFSWECTTTPVIIEGYKPSAHIVIDASKLSVADLAKLATLEETLYGKDATTDPQASAVDPELPSLATVVSMFTPSL